MKNKPKPLTKVGFGTLLKRAPGPGRGNMENPPFAYTLAAWIVMTSLAIAWIIYSVPHLNEWLAWLR